MVKAQVFSSLCPRGWSCPVTLIDTKSLLVLGLIAPSNLEIPAAPTPSLFVSTEFKHALGGWERIFLYYYTCLINLKPPPPDDRDSVSLLLNLKFYYWAWSFGGTLCTKGYPDKIELHMTEWFFLVLFFLMVINPTSPTTEKKIPAPQWLCS